MKRNLLVGVLLCVPVISTIAGCASSRAAGERTDTDDDQAITQRVTATLAVDPEVHQLPIDVDTSNRYVTLTGTVDNEDQKRRVEQLADETIGVDGVRNRLVVTAPATVEIADGGNDNRLTNKVEAKLASHLGLRALDIDVDSRNGIVRLSGETENKEAATKAGRVAFAVEGVKSVENNLTVSEAAEDAETDDGEMSP